MTPVLVLAGAVVVLDQLTKAVALERLVPGHPVVVFDGWLSLTLVMNPGLAFGLLGSEPPAWRGVVAALSVVARRVLARVALRVLPTGGWDLANVWLRPAGVRPPAEARRPPD